MEPSPNTEAAWTALVYDELRQLARRYLDRERQGHMLQPTDLVHEAWAKLNRAATQAQRDRVQFLATAARAMREILVDHARARLTAKRGGGAARITLVEGLAPSAEPEVDLIALDDALQQLTELDPRKARMVELRFFAGLSIEETAEALGVSHMTVSNDWRMVRAWLAAQLGG
ncbi:MAG: ECF-type sigma factor [Planctomycetota bacterium]